MDVKAALISQYRAGLLMLKECIELCPDDLWAAGVHPRTTWRIAFHALFYAHFYAMPNHETFTPWERNVWHGRILWDSDEEGDPPKETTFTQQELIEYLDFIHNNIGEWVNALDLDSLDSGFPWYPISKLEHQIVNVRHIGVHVGQLQELLYARDIEPRWKGRG